MERDGVIGDYMLVLGTTETDNSGFLFTFPVLKFVF